MLPSASTASMPPVARAGTCAGASRAPRSVSSCPRCPLTIPLTRCAPSTLPDQLPAVSDEAQDSQISYVECFTTSDGVKVMIWYEDGAVLDRDSLARVLAQVRGADWEEVSVDLSGSQAPRFMLIQRLDDEDRLTAEVSTPVLSVLDDCTVKKMFCQL